MKRLKSFLKTSLLGGVVVILPIAILASVMLWLFKLISGLIAPLTLFLIKDSQLNEYIAEIIVIALIMAACFFVGVLVRTRLGSFLYRLVESRVLKLAPGYSMVKETVIQLFGDKNKSPFSSVALAQIFCNDTLVTCFITDKHEDGKYTLFVPTGPNPTSGLIYHLDEKYVHPIDIPVQEAMRSIISCGAGTAKLVKEYGPASQATTE